MPYINQKDREKLDYWIGDLAKRIVTDCEAYDMNKAAGLINYTCTTLVLKVLAYQSKKFTYSTLALVSGIFSNIASEWYRRVGVPYEEQKTIDNGDIDWRA